MASQSIAEFPWFPNLVTIIDFDTYSTSLYKNLMALQKDVFGSSISITQDQSIPLQVDMCLSDKARCASSAEQFD